MAFTPLPQDVVRRELGLPNTGFLSRTGSIYSDQATSLSLITIYDPIRLKEMTQIRESVIGRPTADTKQRVWYRFFINPHIFRDVEAKTVQTRLTKKGWERIYFPPHNGMILMTFSGRSGSLIPPRILQSIGIRDIRFSFAWQKFAEFKNFYRTAVGDLVLIYDGMKYVGGFDRFDFNQDANDPFGIDYNFTFSAYPDRVRPILGKVGDTILSGAGGVLTIPPTLA